MKHLLKTIGLLSAFISACTISAPIPEKEYEYNVPVKVKETFVDTSTFEMEIIKSQTINSAFEKAELKSENIIPADEEVCEIITGCAVDEVGKCIGCSLKKRDLATLKFKDEGSLRSGDYRITTLMKHTGEVIRWTIPLKMTLINISKATYLMTFSGIGKVAGETVDCSSPFVATFTIDENNMEKSFIMLDGGSCPHIKSDTYKAKWESNEYGLKKMKSYSNGECIVGPCDWIYTKTNVYFYERI